MLALLYDTLGNYEQAGPLYERAHEIMEKVWGTGNPNIALSLEHLASFYKEQEKYEQAELFYLRALASYEKCYTWEETLSYLEKLAEFYSEQENYEQEESFYLRILASMDDHLGCEHPNTISYFNQLTKYYKGKGENERAELLYMRELLFCERAFGHQHPKTRTTRMKYTDRLRSKGYSTQTINKRLYEVVGSGLTNSDLISPPGYQSRYEAYLAAMNNP